MITDFLTAETPKLRFSPAESARFGMSVARLLVPLKEHPSASQLEEMINGSAADLVILRCESQARELNEWLAGLNEWRCLHADTLVYFSRELSDLDTDRQEITGDIVNRDQLQLLARRTFATYRNHYSSNSRIPESAVQEGYSEWLHALLSDPAARTFVTAEDGEYLSFVLTYELATIRSAEIVLNGTHPDHESHGHYSRLVARALRSFKSTGAEKVWISTQASNRRVIRAWIRLGFNFEHAINTYHLMGKTSAR
jgi:ribosomal protein S18 acetylase RimI-like enzyme